LPEKRQKGSQRDDNLESSPRGGRRGRQARFRGPVGRKSGGGGTGRARSECSTTGAAIRGKAGTIFSSSTRKKSCVTGDFGKVPNFPQTSFDSNETRKDYNEISSSRSIKNLRYRGVPGGLPKRSFETVVGGRGRGRGQGRGNLAVTWRRGAASRESQKTIKNPQIGGKSQDRGGLLTEDLDSKVRPKNGRG